MKKLILILLFCLLLCQLHANTPEKAARRAMLELYAFNFAKADSLITGMENAGTHHFLSAITRSQYYWWKLITNKPGSSYHLDFHNSIVAATEMLEPLYERTPHDDNLVFYLIYAYASGARLDLLYGNYFSATKRLNRSVDLINFAHGRENLHQPYMLTSGLYNYVVDYGSRRYPPLRLYTVFLPRGDMELGLQQLIKAAEMDDPVIKTEAHYFLMKIFMEIEADHERALLHAEWLTSAFPRNLVFLYHHHEIATVMGDANAAALLMQQMGELLRTDMQLSDEQRNHFKTLLGL